MGQSLCVLLQFNTDISKSWLHEFWGHDAEERAIVIAVSQTLGYVFIAWVPCEYFVERELFLDLANILQSSSIDPRRWEICAQIHHGILCHEWS